MADINGQIHKEYRRVEEFVAVSDARVRQMHALEEADQAGWQEVQKKAPSLALTEFAVARQRQALTR